MSLRDDIVAEARRWIGTPFRHQGRALGVGVDCAGLVVSCARACGLVVSDMAGYSRTPDGRMLQAELERQALRVQMALPGDIYLMRFAADPQHLAIASDLGLIHAFSAVGKCVEHGLDNTWRRRIVAIYRFKELA